MINFSKEGRKDTAKVVEGQFSDDAVLPLVLDILATGLLGLMYGPHGIEAGVLMIGGDYIGGAFYELKPNPVNATLEC